MHTGHLATGRKARFSAFKQCAGQATVHRGRTTKEREKQRPVHTHPQSMHTHKKTQTHTHTPAQTHRHPHTQTKTTTHSKANSFLCREPAMRVSERVHPTADLTPAPHKMCNKLLKFASYIPLLHATIPRLGPTE